MTDEFAFAADETKSELASETPTTFFGSADEFFRRFLRYSYRRLIGVPGKADHVWRGDWWRNEEASCRIEAMWRSWEAARLDPTGMSTWWTSVADRNMAQLLSPAGPVQRFRGQEPQRPPIAVSPTTSWHVPAGPPSRRGLPARPVKRRSEALNAVPSSGDD